MGKKSSLICLAVLFGIVVAASLIQYKGIPDNRGGPRIQVKPKSFDFGDIPRKTVEKTFIVENTGESELEIIAVSTSCGCTTAKVSREKIGPGETAELFVEMDPNVMGNITGRVKRIIYVQSNDMGRPEVEAVITANILD